MYLTTQKNFTEKDWRLAFDAYVAVNKSHWTGPPFEIVQSILDKKGRYEFGFQAMGTWTSKFLLEVRDEKMYAEFVLNPEATGRIRDHLEKMRTEFVALLATSFPR